MFDGYRCAARRALQADANRTTKRWVRGLAVSLAVVVEACAPSNPEGTAGPRAQAWGTDPGCTATAFAVAYFVDGRGAIYDPAKKHARFFDKYFKFGEVSVEENRSCGDGRTCPDLCSDAVAKVTRPADLQEARDEAADELRDEWGNNHPDQRPGPFQLCTEIYEVRSEGFGPRLDCTGFRKDVCESTTNLSRRAIVFSDANVFSPVCDALLSKGDVPPRCEAYP